MSSATHTLECATAANMVAESGFQVLVGRARFAGQQCGSFHDHPGLAIATLGDVLFNPCQLAGMAAANRQTFDGYVALALGGRERNLAGADGGAILMHRAGATGSYAASVLCSSKAQQVTQSPQ